MNRTDSTRIISVLYLIGYTVIVIVLKESTFFMDAGVFMVGLLFAPIPILLLGSLVFEFNRWLVLVFLSSFVSALFGYIMSEIGTASLTTIFMNIMLLAPAMLPIVYLASLSDVKE